MSKAFQFSRVHLVFHQFSQDGPAGHATDFADHRTQLDVRPFQHLLNSIEDACPIADQLRSLASQITAIALFERRNETGFEQPMLQEICQPLGILYISLASWNTFNVLGVDQE